MSFDIIQMHCIIIHTLCQINQALQSTNQLNYITPLKTIHTLGSIGQFSRISSQDYKKRKKVFDTCLSTFRYMHITVVTLI